MRKRLVDELDATALLHGSVCFIAATTVCWGVGRLVDWLDMAFLKEVAFQFVTAHISQHDAVHHDAGGEALTAFLLHFPAERGILDDVLLFVGELVFPHYGADAFTPAAVSFEVGSDFGVFVHGVRVGMGLFIIGDKFISGFENDAVRNGFRIHVGNAGRGLDGVADGDFAHQDGIAPHAEDHAFGKIFV